MNGSGDMTATGDEVLAGIVAELHNGSVSKQTAELNGVTDSLTVCGDNSDCCSLGVSNADGDLVCDNTADDCLRGVAGDSYHIKTNTLCFGNRR